MEWIKNLKISDKLKLLISLSLFFVVVTGAVGFYFTNKTSEAMTKLYNDRTMPIAWFSSIKDDMLSNKANILSMIATNNNTTKRTMIQKIRDARTDRDELLAKYETTKLDPFEIENISKYKEGIQTLTQIENTLISLAKADKDSTAFKYFESKSQVFFEVDAIIDALSNYNQKVAEELDTQGDKDGAEARIMLAITILSSFGLLILLGLMISKMITGPISQAVGELNEGAQQVASASEQLSAASQQLAEGSSEQAAAIQETSASIEESDSMVKQNTENTQEAAALAKKTKDYADRSNQKMNNMMVSMEELKKSSDEIAKIIKVIDEIAFQTNILALNAAVEAARAGDAGKGFAVVAEEVRNLAQRSAEATKDTAKIIESNILLSKQSVEMTQEINNDIKEIDIQALKVSELLSEIAVASKEQAQGISQINTAISQMEQVVQANASTAEESASASLELSGQAANVKEIVNILLVMVEGAEALRTKLYR